MKSKKFIACLLAASLAASLCACSDSKDGGSDETKETTKTEETTKADETEATEAETEPTETEPAIPEGFEECVAINSFLGVKATYLIPIADEEWKINERDNLEGYGTTYYGTVNGKSFSISVFLSCFSTGSIDWDLENNDPVPNTEYRGYITGHTSTQSCPMNFFTDNETYLDGVIKFTIDPECDSEDMDEAEYANIVETIQKSVVLEVLDENQLYTASGMITDPSGLFEFPVALTLDGFDAECKISTSTNSVHASATASDCYGGTVTVTESRSAVESNFTYMLEHYDTGYECEIAGYPANCYAFNDFGVLRATVVVKFSDEVYYEYALKEVDGFDSTDLYDQLKEDPDMTEIHDFIARCIGDYINASTMLFETNAE